MSTFHIKLKDLTGEVIETTSFEKFNKYAIHKAMREFAKLAKEGCEIEYWKQDAKYFYIPMLTIVKRNGRFLREVIRHGKIYYRQSLILS